MTQAHDVLPDNLSVLFNQQGKKNSSMKRDKNVKGGGSLNILDTPKKERVINYVVRINT